MTLNTVPSSIWRVSITGSKSSGLTRTFTTRSEARQYRRDLRSNGYDSDSIVATRYTVDCQGNVSL